MEQFASPRGRRLPPEGHVARALEESQAQRLGELLQDPHALEAGGRMG